MTKVLIENYSFEIEKLRHSLKLYFQGAFDGKFHPRSIVGFINSKYNGKLLS